MTVVLVCLFAGTACCSHMREERPAREGERKGEGGRRGSPVSVPDLSTLGSTLHLSITSLCNVYPTPSLVPPPTVLPHRAVCEWAKWGDLTVRDVSRFLPHCLSVNDEPVCSDIFNILIHINHWYYYCCLLIWLLHRSNRVSFVQFIFWMLVVSELSLFYR